MAFSEEDLLRCVDLLTRAERELRQSPDPRVALELALLKLVQMRRLLPFAELVAGRTARARGGFLGGLPRPGRLRARPAGGPRSPATRTVSRPPAHGAAVGPSRARRRFRAVAPEAVEAPPAPAAGGGGPLRSRRHPRSEDAGPETRPSLGQPLRSARGSDRGQHAGPRGLPGLRGLGHLISSEYQDLASKAAGHTLVVEIATAGATAPPAPETASPSPERDQAERLHEGGRAEPAVQEVARAVQREDRGRPRGEAQGTDSRSARRPS